MEQKLIQKQTQKMLFTPRMQESMHILQIPIVELKNLIEDELQANPLLEEVNHEAPPIKTSPKIEDNDYRRDLRLTKPLTLQENLLRQLNTIATSHEDIDIGEEIIGNIDDDGYLKAGVEEMAQSLDKDIIKVEAMASVVQSLEPVGVGARDLKECLLIQLQAKGKKDSLAWRIAENHLVECGKKQYLKIAKTMGASIDEVKAAISEIARLEPKPGRSYFSQTESQYIAPDIYVRKFDEEHQILTNEFDLPRVRINSFYTNILNDKKSDKETQDYIRGKLKAANFLIKCIGQRWETMQKITEFLVKEQAEGIEKGRSFLKPLTFKEAAKAIGRHESTISRAIANKYMETPSGLFEFREFFNGKIANVNGSEGSKDGAENNNDHSAISVKIELKALVDKEDKRKPLSDQKLLKILAHKDIKISRRTIAKYREELKILPSYLRKT